jgi:hypothetical protein
MKTVFTINGNTSHARRLKALVNKIWTEYDMDFIKNRLTNSVTWVREWTILIERLPIGEISANVLQIDVA